MVFSKGMLARIKAEAKRRYKRNHNSAYGSAHIVLSLCREIQRQRRKIKALKRRLE
jgi:hypothetical protein